MPKPARPSQASRQLVIERSYRPQEEAIRRAFAALMRQAKDREARAA